MPSSSTREPIVRLLSALMLLAVVAGAAIAADERKGDAAQRVEVPIRVAYQPNGAVRFSIPVQIGDGPPFEALLDTGSSGLRVLPGTVPRSAYRSTTSPAGITYSSGVQLRGTVAEAVVRIGGLASDGPIRFMAIDAVSCTTARPDCPAHDLRVEDFRIGAGRQPGQGFRAIIGVGLRGGPQLGGVVNPLAQLPGNASFIIDVPRYGTARGRLIVNPDEAERAGYTAFALERLPAEAALPNGVPAWRDNRLPGCIADGKRGIRICAPTVLDSGAETIEVLSAAPGAPPVVWPPGTEVRFTIGNPPASAVEMTFTVAAPPRRSRDLVRTQPAERGTTMIRAGVLPYFYFAVLYDQRNGVIGLARR
jgi:hypothetical protein